MESGNKKAPSLSCAQKLPVLSLKPSMNSASVASRSAMGPVSLIPMFLQEKNRTQKGVQHRDFIEQVKYEC